MEKKFLTFDGLTFDDVLLVPGYSEVIPKDVNVSTKFTKKIMLNQLFSYDKIMDNMLVKKIEIPRWGNFYFSRKYTHEKIYNLLIEAQTLYLTINELPILPNLFSELEEDLMRRSIFGTAAIEGNPLSEEEY